jgi:hypothetical protein
MGIKLRAAATTAVFLWGIISETIDKGTNRKQ